jgi:hypothetical protein
MKAYTVFEKDGVKVAVKQGWLWPAFFLSWIWAFTKNLMLPGGICLAILAVGLFLGLIVPLGVIAGIVFGIMGNKWWDANLLKNGYSKLGTVKAKNPAEAVSTRI